MVVGMAVNVNDKLNFRYKYIALLDIDEVIVPLEHDSWSAMMAEVVEVSGGEVASWSFRNVYFLDNMTELREAEGGQELPQHFHMMRHIYRTETYNAPGANIKCFHNPEKVLTLHNHFPHSMVANTKRSFPVSTSVGHLQHYRTWCAWYLAARCARDFMAHQVRDTTLWRWREAVVGNTTLTLSTLGLG